MKNQNCIFEYNSNKAIINIVKKRRSKYYYNKFFNKTEFIKFYKIENYK